ncbi:MAG: AbrB family transcriptional regulator [Arenicella sp.]
MKHLLTLGIASLGGALLHLTQMPLAWLLGAMLLTALSSQFLKQLHVHKTLRLSATALLGTVVGALVNANIFSLLLKYAPSITAMLCFQLLLVIVGTYFFLHRTSTSRLSALLATYPGSISQITALSLERTCDVQLIAMNHTSRLFVVISCIPLLITFVIGDFSASLPDTVNAVKTPDAVINYAWPLGVALLGFYSGKACHIMTPALFGPMLLAAILSVTGLTPDASTGKWLIPIAQIIIGASIGLHFQHLNKHQWKRMLSIHLPYALILLTFTIISGWLLHIFLDIPFDSSLLIMAPGGLSEMVLIAFALDIDPVMVTAHHVIRSLFGFLFIPWLMQFWAKPKNCEKKYT